MKITNYLLGIIIVGLLSFNNAYSIDQILITKSSGMDQVIFDGKWSYVEEWKPSSVDTFLYPDGTQIVLRSAHQGDFIYFFVDYVSDIRNFEKVSDKAIICLDNNNHKSVIPNSNDYCFLVPLDGKTSYVLQGGSPLSFTSNYQKIPLPDGLVGIGGISDQNDRYSNIPHPSYELKIPTSLVGRSNLYGLYVGIYHAHTNKLYSWPTNVTSENSFQIPTPDKWGELVSPDNSLPEFPSSLLILPIAFILLLYYTRFRSNLF